MQPVSLRDPAPTSLASLVTIPVSALVGALATIQTLRGRFAGATNRKSTAVSREPGNQSWGFFARSLARTRSYAPPGLSCQ